MKKGMIIGLAVSITVIVAVAVFFIVKIPATGSSVENQEEAEDAVLENIVINPLSFEISLAQGEEKTETLEITNNNRKSAFVRCGIYNAYSDDKHAPDLSCETSEQTENGFVEIPKSKTKTFSIEIKTELNAQYMDADGNLYKITTNRGDYNNKVLLDIGTSKQEQKTIEIPLEIKVPNEKNVGTGAVIGSDNSGKGIGLILGIIIITLAVIAFVIQRKNKLNFK